MGNELQNEGKDNSNNGGDAVRPSLFEGFKSDQPWLQAANCATEKNLPRLELYDGDKGTSGNDAPNTLAENNGLGMKPRNISDQLPANHDLLKPGNILDQVADKHSLIRSGKISEHIAPNISTVKHGNISDHLAPNHSTLKPGNIGDNLASISSGKKPANFKDMEKSISEEIPSKKSQRKGHNRDSGRPGRYTPKSAAEQFSDNSYSWRS